MAEGMLKRARTWAVLAAVAAGLGGWLAPPRAAAFDMMAQGRATFTLAVSQDGSLRDRLFGRDRHEVPAVGRFTSQGGPAFVLDQSGARPLLRFEGSNEIWVLRPAAGVRGDIYYRNDVGEVVLRETRLGGLTLYTNSTPGGVPCAPRGAAERLTLRDFTVGALFRHLLREAARGGLAGGRGTLEINATADDAPGVPAVLADAATVAVDALVRTASSDVGRQRAASIALIEIEVGASPEVRREGSTLRITVTPRLGVAGRPSSARVARALAP